MKRSGLTSLVAILVAVSCSLGTDSPTAPVQQSPPAAGTFVLAVGQKVALAPSISLSLERVVSDSRCPSDVTCVSAGEVKVALVLESGSGSQKFQLSDRAPSATVQGISLTLGPVEPYPKAAAPIPAAAYRVSIEVGGS